ncbi:MAG: CHAT domain-containing protein, partial [Alphaproteobacteria bacterium]
MFICLLIVNPVGPLAAQPTPTVETLNADVDRLVAAFDFDGAYKVLAMVRSLLANESEPDGTEILTTDIMLGVLARATRRYRESDIHLSRAEAAVNTVFADPVEQGYHLAWARQERAINFLELGRYRRAARLAINAFETRQSATPNDFNRLMSDAMVTVRAFVNLEQWHDAMLFLGKGIDLLPKMRLEGDLTDINTFAVLLTQTLHELGQLDFAADYPQNHFELAAAIDLHVSDNTRAQLAYHRTIALTKQGNFQAALAETDAALIQVDNGAEVSRRSIAQLWHARGVAALHAGSLETANDALSQADAHFMRLSNGESRVDRLRVNVDQAALIVERGAPFEGFPDLFQDIAERIREEATRMALGRRDWHEVRLRQMRVITRRAIDLMANVQADQRQPQWPTNVVAFHLAQLARFGETGAAVSQMAARVAAGSGDLAQLIRRRENALEERIQAEHQLTQLAGRQGAPATSQRSTALATRLEILDRELSSIDTRLGKEFPSFSELVTPTIIDWERIAASIHRYPSEVILFYVVGEQNSLVWAFNGGGIGARYIPAGRAELEDRIRRLRRSLDPTGISRVGDVKPYDLELAHDLYKLLVEPAQGLLFDTRTKHIIVVPDGPLTGLPFEILVSQLPDPAVAYDRPFEKYRKARWLGLDYAISVAPTISAFAVLRETAGVSGAPQPFLGIGDPILGEHPAQRNDQPWPTPSRDAAGEWIISVQRSAGALPFALFRDGRGNVDALRKLPSLPETAQELAAIARSLGADNTALMLREHATERAVRQRGDLSEFRVVAFATHGLTAGELDGS